jgi:hypothetical protein
MTKARSNATAPAAKGQIVVGTGSELSGILSAGSNGDTLLADSSTSTGLRWQVTPVIAQPVLNGGYDIWQRGTSFTFTGTEGKYVADRWYGKTFGNSSVISRQTTNDTTNLPFIQYCSRVSRNSGQTSTQPTFLSQSFETSAISPFNGKFVTLSFYARKGADLSGTLKVFAQTGTGTEANVTEVAFTSATNIIEQTISSSITTTWQRYSFSADLGTAKTQFAVYFRHDPSGTAGAADYFEVTGVQIDVGQGALPFPFRRTGGTLQGELAACQRYYFRQTATAAFSNLTGFGYEQGATSAQYSFFPTVTMRVKPSSVDFSAIKVSDYNSSFAITAFALNGNNADGSYFLVDATIASGGTAGRPCVIQANNNSAAYIGFSAEL